jgi:hypothetical protein
VVHGNMLTEEVTAWMPGDGGNEGAEDTGPNGELFEPSER